MILLLMFSLINLSDRMCVSRFMFIVMNSCRLGKRLSWSCCLKSLLVLVKKVFRNLLLSRVMSWKRVFWWIVVFYVS